MMTTSKPSSTSDQGNIQLIFRRLLVAAFALWILVVAGRLVVVELQTAPSFDGAMNLEVAHSLAHGEGYRRMYAPRHLFPHEIQTKAPFILPAAAVFRLFGVGIVQSELVNVIYFLALVLLSYLILRAAGAGAASMLGIAAILATPGILRFGFAGYGEIPGLMWFLAATAVYFWPRPVGDARLSMAFYAGILLALAYLTKTVMLIGIVVFGFIVLIDLFFLRRKSIRVSLPEIASLAGGAILPIATFESWKLAALGGFGPWLDWWRTEQGNILWQAGVPHGHKAGSIGLIHKVLHHLEVLSGFYGLPQWIVGGWLVLVFSATLIALAKARRDRRYLVVTVILGTAAAYFVWWLALTPDIRAWLRRIMNGMLLANLGMLTFAWTSAVKSAKNILVSRARALLFLAFPAITLCQQSGAIISQGDPDTADLLTSASVVHNLPQDAYIFGLGWDSAPVVALFSGRIITNFNQLPVPRLEPNRPAYVIKQPSTGASEPINHAFSMYGVTVPRTSKYGVYRIPSFTPNEMKFVPERVKSIITDNEDYPYAQGAYKAVPGFGIWLASDNLFVLRSTRSQSFKMTGYTPPRNKYLYADTMHAVVSFNGCRTAPKPVPNDKLFTLYFNVPADCSQPHDGVWHVRIEVDNVIDFSNPQGDHRSLSILAKELGFVDAGQDE
jgi:hypothetical protein